MGASAKGGTEIQFILYQRLSRSFATKETPQEVFFHSGHSNAAPYPMLA